MPEVKKEAPYTLKSLFDTAMAKEPKEAKFLGVTINIFPGKNIYFDKGDFKECIEKCLVMYSHKTPTVVSLHLDVKGKVKEVVLPVSKNGNMITKEYFPKDYYA